MICLCLCLFLCVSAFAQNLEYVAKEVKADNETQIDTLDYDLKDIDIGGAIYSCECALFISKNETFLLTELFFGNDRFVAILEKFKTDKNEKK